MLFKTRANAPINEFERAKKELVNRELLAESIKIRHTTVAPWLRDQKMEESDAILRKIRETL